MTFKNLPELADALMLAAQAKIDAMVFAGETRTSRGYSNQSCSSYLTVTQDYLDADGDEAQTTFKLRFSDHADRYGSDYTVRVDVAAVTDVEVDGDFSHVEITDEDFAAMVADGVEEVVKVMGA